VARKMLRFRDMNGTELRQWVEANPGRVDELDARGQDARGQDARGHSPLYVAAIFKCATSRVVGGRKRRRRDCTDKWRAHRSR